jgi:peptide/nickel transport system substrate-binding protein
MRRTSLLLLMAALAFASSGCRKQPEGAVKVVVIGGKPRLADPAKGPLTLPEAVLLQNVAQGLVRFDAAGNIVPGLAERWNVSDDGLSYIFRIASSRWADGRKITAEQVARLLERQLSSRGKNGLKDSLGAIDDVVAMTDRVIEVRLLAPRPNLLSLLAQPEFAIVRNGHGTGPFTAVPAGAGGGLRLTREIVSADEESSVREEVLLDGTPTAAAAVLNFAAARSDLVLGGTFADLPYAEHANLPRNSLRFDPASGLFGLVPLKSGGLLDEPEVRRLLSQAIDRDGFVTALAVPGLAPRATLLEPGLDGMPPPVAPPWFGTAKVDRLAGLQAAIDELFPKAEKPTIRIALPQGPGADLLFQLLSRDWGALGFKIDRAESGADADFALIDNVAPSSSPAWFIRRFRCAVVPVCDSDADDLMDAAREIPVPAQRYALLAQAAEKIDEAQLFIPIAAPVRWSLVSRRIEGFAGNRFARHTLTGLTQRPDSGG